MVKESDEALMDMALALAAQGQGGTTPNPMVGAVVVQRGQVVGRGFHRRAGRPHAEVEALEEAGDAARGATLYCTLEPCCHTGRTGPCVEVVLRAGVREVVVGVEDPDSRVSGRGIEFLRTRGVLVRVGVRRKEATRLNEAFFTVRRHGRPFVTIKAAVSLDGRIAEAPGRRTALSGPSALAHVHSRRGKVDAIAVGSETVLVDDPMLTARGVVRQRPLVRVLFDTRLRTPVGARVLSTLDAGPVLVITTETAIGRWPERAEALRRAGATLKALPSRGVVAALEQLLEFDVSDLLIEGGAALHRGSWLAGVVDRVQLYVCPIKLGSTGVPWMKGTGFSMAGLGPIRTNILGKDVLLEADVQRFD